MAGSYHIDCTIHALSSDGTKAHISYFDPIMDEQVSEWVDRSYIDEADEQAIH